MLTKRSNIVPLRSTGQNLSRSFVVLLRKSIPQNRNLNSAVYRGVMQIEGITSSVPMLVKIFAVACLALCCRCRLLVL